MSNTAGLERSLSNYNATAARCESQAAQFSSLARTAQSCLNHKNNQLSQARRAKRACELVVSAQMTNQRELRWYASSLEKAFESSGFMDAASHMTNSDEEYARNALRAAESLITSLENECRSLSSQVTSYNNQASVLTNRAQSARRAASNTIRAINRARQQH